MNLKEAITHAEERAGNCRTECRREHKQLADWLRELERMREAIAIAAPVMDAHAGPTRLLQFKTLLTHNDESNRTPREALQVAVDTPHMGQDKFTLHVQDTAKNAIANINKLLKNDGS